MTSDSRGMAPAFSSAYERARKAYGLCSALLLAWELIGIEVKENPIENLHISLKSPQAVPYVLIALVLYFGFRLIVEWFQTGWARRRMLAARIDFIVAHIIGLGALSLYAIQTILQIQLVNNIQWRLFFPIVPAVPLGMALSSFYTAAWKANWNLKNMQKQRYFLWRGSVLFAFSLIPFLFFYWLFTTDMLILVAITASVLPMLNAFALWYIRRKMSQKVSENEHE